MDATLAADGRPNEGGRLLKILGIGFGLAICIGATIGVGILRSPGLIAQYIGSPAMIMFAWGLGALYAILGANLLAELATMVPKSGGAYVYTHRALGNYWGFVVGCCDWFQTAAALAFLSVVFGEYSASVLTPNFAGGRVMFSVAVLVILSILNWIGLRSGSEFQKITSFLKALALLAFVAACFLLGGKSASAESIVSDPAAAAGVGLVAFVLGFQLILGTYEGWQGPIYFTEENRDPGRTVPRSLFGGIILIAIIYLLVNAALLYVLPMSQLAGSKFAGADALSVLLGPSSGQVLTILAVLSILGILNAYLMANPRISLALARDGLLPKKFAAVNEGGTPYFALLIVTIVSAALAIVGSFELLLAISQFFAVTIAILSTISFFVLRRREPDAPRPYRAWLYPAAPAIVLLTAVLLFLGFAFSNPFPSMCAFVVLMASYPAYRIIRSR
ncbi:MAG: APC family permease [Acidobacteria bacterium]|nr:APC family permease [Acidobacteriota bacterium]